MMLKTAAYAVFDSIMDIQRPLPPKLEQALPKERFFHFFFGFLSLFLAFPLAIRVGFENS
jgi:hypothetical protein